MRVVSPVEKRKSFVRVGAEKLRLPRRHEVAQRPVRRRVTESVLDQRTFVFREVRVPYRRCPKLRTAAINGPSQLFALIGCLNLNLNKYFDTCNLCETKRHESFPIFVRSYKLLIVGGGSGGLATANKFASKLGDKKVAVIEPSHVSCRPLSPLPEF